MVSDSKMLIELGHPIYYNGIIGLTFQSKSISFEISSSVSELIFFVTKKGYCLVTAKENMFKTQTSYSTIKPKIKLALAKPPKRKTSFSFKPLSYKKLLVFVFKSNNLELTDRLRFSIFLLYLQTFFRPLPLIQLRTLPLFQTLVWSAGYHLKYKKRGFVLSKITKKYDTVKSVSVIEDFSFFRKVFIRQRNSYYPMNSFHFKLR